MQQNKIASLKWVSTITHVSEDDLILNAPFLDLVVDGVNLIPSTLFEKKLKQKEKSGSYQSKHSVYTANFYCMNCGIKYQTKDDEIDLEEDKYCKNCWENIADIIERFEQGLMPSIRCVSCGRPTIALQNYCVNCGAKLKRERIFYEATEDIRPKRDFYKNNKSLVIALAASGIIGAISSVIALATIWESENGIVPMIAFLITGLSMILMIILSTIIQIRRSKY